MAYLFLHVQKNRCIFL
uniref:Photosystem I subunit VIII n=1 Tax=Cistanche salsa TaxID=161396 RepID=A0A6G9IEC4_CISSA|nr:photosystem I subunit VIII [Cistanche salsa]